MTPEEKKIKKEALGVLQLLQAKVLMDINIIESLSLTNEIIDDPLQNNFRAKMLTGNQTLSITYFNKELKQ